MEKSQGQFLENSQEKPASDYVDKMLAEIYGERGIEDFNALWKKNPEWSLEEALLAFEKRPTNQQTYFFRSKNLEVIAQEIIPDIEKNKKEGEEIKILDIGSSSGEEAYSLGVHMLEKGIHNFSIEGIDVNPEKVRQAKQGKYKLSIDSLKDINRYNSDFKKEFIDKKYFLDSGERWMRRSISHKYSLRQMSEMKKQGEIPEDAWETTPGVIMQLSPELQKKTSFMLHDMLEGPYRKGEFDIAVMSNVLLHYPEKGREIILKNALSSLRHRGVLALESKMRPIRAEEVDWLLPYNEWRDRITEKFPLQEIGGGNYFRFLGWGKKEL